MVCFRKEWLNLQRKFYRLASMALVRTATLVSMTGHRASTRIASAGSGIRLTLALQHHLRVSDRHSKIGTAKVFHNSECHANHAPVAVY
jgi:hypothetical protein